MTRGVRRFLDLESVLKQRRIDPPSSGAIILAPGYGITLKNLGITLGRQRSWILPSVRRQFTRAKPARVLI
jgi:hypothetical protein